MAKTGRPKKEINQEEFEKLCGIQCTEQEIAGWFRCSIDTINNWCKSTYGQTFSDTYKKFSADGKMSLRRVQWKLAQNNVTMAIWLGRNWLGQDDGRNENREEDEKIKEKLKDFKIEIVDASKKEGGQ